MMTDRGRRGFTLLELMLVVAIIAALAGIISVVAAQARENARRTQCIQQIRQLLLAVKMYEDDYGFVPIHHDHPPEENVQRILLELHYVTDARIFICPSDPTRGMAYGTDWDWDGSVRMSYIYNMNRYWEPSSFGYRQLADNNPLWWCPHHPHYGGGYIVGEYGGKVAYNTSAVEAYGGTTPIFEGVTPCMRELAGEYGPEAIDHLSECGSSLQQGD
jgi:prepilin-type N-terminal cleavage/methylation domain-containing protein